MKYLAFAFIVFYGINIEGISQGPPPLRNKLIGPFTPAPQGTQTNFMVDPAWKSRTIEAGAVWGIYNDIKGTAFYRQEWDKGYIRLRDNRVAQNVPIAFNVYTNEIFYKADSQVLVVDASAPVAEFGILNKEDSGKATVFRRGYSAINDNTEKTFYKVAADDKMVLLVYYNKRLIERNNSLGVPERVFVDYESWYIYNALENKISPVKKNKKSLLAALPQYANDIESIIKEKNLKLKTEEDWVILFNELNKRIE